MILAKGMNRVFLSRDISGSSPYLVLRLVEKSEIKTEGPDAKQGSTSRHSYLFADSPTLRGGELL